LVTSGLRRGLADFRQGEREASTKVSTVGLDGDGRKAIPVVGLDPNSMLVAANASTLHHSAEGGLVGDLLEDEVVRESNPVMEGPVVFGGEGEGGVAGLDGPGTWRKVRSDEDI
jgi:hypothetical protein